MKPSPFDYLRVSDLGHALEALADPDCKILAGGQSLVAMLRLRLAAPTLLVDISRLPELRTVSADGLTIGACVTHRELESGKLGAPARAALPVLAQTAPLIGHAPIRTRGTFGGSIAHADPSAEWCLLARLLDARITARSRVGERELSAGEFFEGFLTTALRSDEILTSVRFPSVPDVALVREMSRRHGDFALVTVGVAVWSRGTHIALGGVGGTVVRAQAAEQRLADGPLTEDAIAEAAELAVGACTPAADIHGPADYRRHLVQVLTRRTLTEAAHRLEERR
ncbi:FAD binding domain-containing protein [Amycolatopsis jejuensis]|uniref:FAD binding domain-containing protein n=1 Tax=Amycolatopsis jejuensis TaxID=330084 RepID=UPI000524ADAC|nr:xanthine dehydrogenase family protein subunit M [Amycolatopsis jejuensis]